MIVNQILLVSALLIWYLEDMLILGFKDVVFITRNVCGRRQLAFFRVRVIEISPFALDRKKKRLHIGTLDKYIPKNS